MASTSSGNIPSARTLGLRGWLAQPPADETLSDATLDHLRLVTGAADPPGSRYQLEREIGRGGMGSVYRAWDAQLQRYVAIKIASADWHAPRTSEGQIMAQLEHPGIVPVYDSGQLPDGRQFYVMRLVEGERLDRFLARETHLTARLRVFLKICDAVAYAHSRGLVHRDLKPANVMLGNYGEVFVMDWGLSSAVASKSALAGGTPEYMPPEQLDSAVDPRSDIYSLGALLRDFLGDARARPLLAVATRAQSPDPALRYESAGRLSEEITRFLDHEPVHAYREPLVERMQRFGRRNAILLLLITAYLVARIAVYFFIRR